VLSLLLLLGFSSTAWSEDGVTDSEIRIGWHLDLSGPIVGMSNLIKDGALMAQREINEAGGIHGRKINLVIGDHGYDPKKAIMLTNKQLTRDKIFMVGHNLGTTTSMACMPILMKKKVPFFPMAQSIKFYQPPKRYVFVFWPSYNVQTGCIVKYMVEQKKKKRFAIMYQDDDMGHELLRGMKDQLKVYNMKLVGAEPYKRMSTVFNTQIARLKKTNPEVFIFASGIRETVGAMKEMKKISWWDFEKALTSPSMSHHTALLAKKSGFDIDGTYGINSYPDVTIDDAPFTVAWRKRHQEWFGKPAQHLTIAGYEPLHLMVEGFKRAGRNLTREGFVEAMETYKDVPCKLGGPPMTLGPNRRVGTKSYLMVQFKGMNFYKVSDFISVEE
jgi:ABC-type branched-subunit amino acid transport system substrate-binding protein